MDDSDKTRDELVTERVEKLPAASPADDARPLQGPEKGQSAPVSALYGSLFDLSSEGIVVFTRGGSITDANQAFRQYMDLTAEELEGMNLGDLFANRDDWARFIDELQDRGTVRDFEWQARTGLGRQRDCLATAAGLSGRDGTPIVYQAIVRDVTEHKKSVEILVHTDRMKALGEMAGAVSHNIRNLLQIIVGNTRLALSNLDSGSLSEARSHLEQILGRLRSAGETARLLNHFAGLKKDRSLRGARNVDLSRVAQKAVEMCRSWLEADASREGVSVNIRSVLQPGCLVRGMESELLEVVVNILWNAAEALPSGGDILLGTRIYDKQVVLEIVDNGVGIPESNLDKVFQPFWTTKGALATGLGLASSYGIVTRHGGEISLESALGQGTRCTVRLPLAEKTFERAAARIPRTADFNLKILVVDDLKPLLRILTTGLVRRGQTVFSAASGAEALEIFDKTPVDVVVCDLAMPDMNGWQVCAALKRMCKERGLAKPPFIILTGWGSQVDEGQRIADCGVDRILEKPMDIPTLLANIRELAQEQLG